MTISFRDGLASTYSAKHVAKKGGAISGCELEMLSTQRWTVVRSGMPRHRATSES